MKKIIVSLFLVLSVSLVFAQKKNVRRAKNLSLMETPDFKGARDAIQAAFADSTTANLPETWHVAGLIGYKENEMFFKDLALGKNVDFVKKGQAIEESIGYFLKSYELDQSQVDKKGRPVKPKFTPDIAAKMKEYYSENHNLFYYAATLFDEKKDYAGALKIFEIYLSIPDMPFMEGMIQKDTTYNKVKYFAAMAARNAENHDKAIELFEDLKAIDYEPLGVNQFLYEEYLTKKDTVNFVRTLKEAFEKMPQEPWFIQNLINYYLTEKIFDEAKFYITKALELLPNEPVYHFINAKIEEIQGNRDAAMVSYNKTLELEPTYADAYAGIGALIVDDAQKVLDDAAYKSDREFNAAKVKSKDMLLNAVEYFKKADEYNPDDLSNKRILRSLYYRLEMSKELEAIEKELGY